MNTLTMDVEAASSGDQKAFARLIAASKNTVTTIALNIVRDVDASEDIAQAVFINCWQNLGSLKNAESFLPWVRQTSRHLALNYLRDNKVGRRADSDEAERAFTEFCNQENSAELELNRQQSKIIVQQLIDELPAASREVVLLYYREQQSSAHVANLLGISEQAVRQKLSRARARLKQDLLSRFGQVILSTVPTVSFSSVVLASVATSPKAAAAVSATQPTSALAKLSWLFSGAMFASLVAVVAVFFSHRMVEKRLQLESDKRLLRSIRNLQIGWILVFGVCFALSYELTEGFLWPLLTYSVFAAGLSVLIRRAQQVAMAGLSRQTGLKPTRSNRIASTLGLYGGLLIGFVGLLSGLIASGRLVF